MRYVAHMRVYERPAFGDDHEGHHIFILCAALCTLALDANGVYPHPLSVLSSEWPITNDFPPSSDWQSGIGIRDMSISRALACPNTWTQKNLLCLEMSYVEHN